MPERRCNPDQTVANRSDSRVQNRTILRFLPVTRYFFGKNFSRADLAGARVWNVQRNDVILGVPSFFSGIRGFGPRGWLHRPDMATWFKLTSKSLEFQAFQSTPALSRGSPWGISRCRTTPQTPKKTHWPLAVLCREAPGRYSPPQASGRFSTDRGLRCVVGVYDGRPSDLAVLMPAVAKVLGAHSL